MIMNNKAEQLPNNYLPNLTFLFELLASQSGDSARIGDINTICNNTGNNETNIITTIGAGIKNHDIELTTPNETEYFVSLTSKGLRTAIDYIDRIHS